MRTFGFPTKIAAALATAAALVAALRLPWYGAEPAGAAGSRPGTVTGPLADLIAGVPRWFTADDGTIGWDLAGRWPMAMAGCAVLAAFAAVLCLAPATEHGGRALLHLCALACTVAAVSRLAVRPDGMEPRFGLLVAVAASATLLVTAQGIVASGLRRRTEVRRYARPVPVPPEG